MRIPSASTFTAIPISLLRSYFSPISHTRSLSLQSYLLWNPVRQMRTQTDIVRRRVRKEVLQVGVPSQTAIASPCIIGISQDMDRNAAEASNPQTRARRRKSANTVENAVGTPEQTTQPDHQEANLGRRRGKRKGAGKQISPSGMETLSGMNDNGEMQERSTETSKKRRRDVIHISKEDKETAVDTPKRRQRGTRKAVVYTEAIGGAEEVNEEVEKPPKRRRRQRTPEEDREYVIPSVPEILPTSFKGRLGYACLNTILRKRKPPVFCSRTCRIDTIKKEGLDYVKELGRQNIIDLCELIRWNEANNIKFLRMSSEMFPFASHEEYGYSLEYAAKELKEAGDLANKLSHRLTSHPGQFTQLGSPRAKVIEGSIRELQYHCEMMDRMGLDKDSVMIIHMGGTYGDKESALNRFKQNYATLPENIKARLVLENDEICYNVDDLLPVCQELNIPLIFDYHHDWIYPSTRPASELIPIINETWHRKGIKPKQHYSEPRPGAVTVMERRAHSDRVKCIPEFCPDDMDLMLECKDKEQACLYLYRLYNLCEVNQRSLRPPAEVETLRTGGRKSSKRKKVIQKDDEVVDDDENDDAEAVEDSLHVSGELSDLSTLSGES